MYILITSNHINYITNSSLFGCIQYNLILTNIYMKLDVIVIIYFYSTFIHLRMYF